MSFFEKLPPVGEGRDAGLDRFGVFHHRQEPGPPRSQDFEDLHPLVPSFKDRLRGFELPQRSMIFGRAKGCCANKDAHRLVFATIFEPVVLREIVGVAHAWHAELFGHAYECRVQGISGQVFGTAVAGCGCHQPFHQCRIDRLRANIRISPKNIHKMILAVVWSLWMSNSFTMIPYPPLARQHGIDGFIGSMK